MARDVRYFTYGTLQRGFANHAAHAEALGEPLGRYVTAAPFPLAVLVEPACTNPGCGFVHRMCALLPDEGDGLPVEGELYAVDRETLAALDALEHYDPADETASTYLRRSAAVEPVDGGEAVAAEVYVVADAARWRQLVASGAAEVLPRYERAHAEGPPKPCCLREPGHAGPHDVIEPD